ncbi:MAG TPA: alpha/beta hydrolase [Ktedonobacterales bacterium]|nr:alpha/beta hydrolase [Ktedonobacterales bacterium]
MTSRHLVDPALIPILDQMPPNALTSETLPLIRATRNAFAQQAAATTAFPDIQMGEHFAPGVDGQPDVRLFVYTPSNAPHPAPGFVWIHGGGYVMGSAVGDHERVKGFVDAIGCVAVSVDYRLAPETPHPGPVEDCYAALQWLHEHADELGVDSQTIAIGGASAGGGLAAALALLARDRGELPIVFQLLIFPMIDDRTAATADPHPYTGEFMWTHDDNRFGWSALLGHEPGVAEVSPYAAAARATSLEGLPPTYISVGALDLFLEEDLDYARRLMRAGVPTELHVYPGAYHGYQFAQDAWMTQADQRSCVEALRRALRSDSTGAER